MPSGVVGRIFCSIIASIIAAIEHNLEHNSPFWKVTSKSIILNNSLREDGAVIRTQAK